MMKKSAIIVGIVGAAVILVVLTLSVASAAPRVPTQRVTFTKEVSNPTPQVGEIFIVTLNVTHSVASTQTIHVRVTDPNPAPAYLRILTGTITGGITGTLSYSSTLPGIVWEGILEPGGTLVTPILFQMEVTGIPTTALTTGYLVTNTAYLNDVNEPGTVAALARATIHIMPERLFLPLVVRNAGG